jgi:ketosteroid isomerase-like protein
MKKVKNYLMLVTITIAFLGSSTLVAQEWTKDQLEIWKTIENAWTEWSNANYEAAFANIHDKYLGWNHEDPLPITKQKWMKSIDSWKDYAKMTYFDIEPARILVHGDVAVVHYYFNYTITYTKGEETKQKKYQGKNAEFSVKEDGKWLLIGDMSVWKD